MLILRPSPAEYFVEIYFLASSLALSKTRRRPYPYRRGEHHILMLTFNLVEYSKYHFDYGGEAPRRMIGG